MKNLLGSERIYDLGNRQDLEQIAAEIIQMAANATLVFLLSERPDQGSLGKLGYSTNNVRNKRKKTGVDFDLVDTDNGLTLYATTSEDKD